MTPWLAPATARPSEHLCAVGGPETGSWELVEVLRV